MWKTNSFSLFHPYKAIIKQPTPLPSPPFKPTPIIHISILSLSGVIDKDYSPWYWVCGKEIKRRMPSIDVCYEHSKGRCLGTERLRREEYGSLMDGLGHVEGEIKAENAIHPLTFLASRS